MTIDQVKVIEIGADAIEQVLQESPIQGLAYPPKLMHAVVAALGRHGFIIEDRYEEESKSLADSIANDPEFVCGKPITDQALMELCEDDALKTTASSTKWPAEGPSEDDRFSGY